MQNFIYGLWHPDDPTDLRHVRYIGYTKDLLRRWREHIDKACEGFEFPKCRWIRKLLGNQCLPAIHVLETATGELKEITEKVWVDKARAVKSGDDPTLLNVGDGGEGGDPTISRMGGLRSAELGVGVHAPEMRGVGGRRSVELGVGIHAPGMAVKGGRQIVELGVGCHAPGMRALGNRTLAAKMRADPTFAKMVKAKRIAGQPFGSTGYRGVREVGSGKFITQFRHKHLGKFDTPQEAADAYDDAVDEYFGSDLLDRLASEGVYVRNRDMSGQGKQMADDPSPTASSEPDGGVGRRPRTSSWDDEKNWG